MYFFLFILFYYIYGLFYFIFLYSKHKKKNKIIDIVKEYNDDNNNLPVFPNT